MSETSVNQAVLIAGIAFPLQLPVREGSEQYEHLGRIRTLYCEPLPRHGTA
jgi:hypothetical protein